MSFLQGIIASNQKYFQKFVQSNKKDEEIVQRLSLKGVRHCSYPSTPDEVEYKRAKERICQRDRYLRKKLEKIGIPFFSVLEVAEFLKTMISKLWTPQSVEVHQSTESKLTLVSENFQGLTNINAEISAEKAESASKKAEITVEKAEITVEKAEITVEKAEITVEKAEISRKDSRKKAKRLRYKAKKAEKEKAKVKSSCKKLNPLISEVAKFNSVTGKIEISPEICEIVSEEKPINKLLSILQNLKLQRVRKQ